MGRSSYQEKLGNLKDHSGADAVRTAGADADGVEKI